MATDAVPSTGSGQALSKVEGAHREHRESRVFLDTDSHRLTLLNSSATEKLKPILLATEATENTESFSILNS
jgi:hypothetical protein